MRGRESSNLQMVGRRARLSYEDPVPTGDSLTTFYFLVAAAITTFVGWLTAQPGWRAKALVWLTIVFVIASLIWLIAPAASPLVQGIVSTLSALIRSGALVMVLTVGTVALMIGNRSPSAGTDAPSITSAQPAFAARANKRVKWDPDIPIYDAAEYLLRRMHQSGLIGISGNDIKAELLDALYSGKLTAWGKDHPDEAEEFQIDQEYWNNAELNVVSGYVFFIYGVAAHKVRLSSAQLKSAYPSEVAE